MIKLVLALAWSLVISIFLLTSCSALCGYHGNGCGYIATDKNANNMEVWRDYK